VTVTVIVCPTSACTGAYVALFVPMFVPPRFH